MRADTIVLQHDRIRASTPLIIDFVRDGWADIDVAAVAGLAHIAPDYFRRIFRGMTGHSLVSLVRRLRLQVAAYRLAYWTRPIIEVAVAAGYGSSAAFSRAFRGEFGSCPADVRARQPEAAWPTRGPCCEGLTTDWRDERQTVAFFRYFGRLDTLPDAPRRMVAWANRHSGQPLRAEHVIVCHDDPERHLGLAMRYDIGVVVDAAHWPTAGIQVLPAGRSLTTRHTGLLGLLPFSYMHLAVAAAMTGQDGNVRGPFVARWRGDEVTRSLRTSSQVSTSQVSIFLPTPASPSQ
jgi:AraC family transcriptional regulator